MVMDSVEERKWVFSRGLKWFTAFIVKCRDWLIEVGKLVKKIGKDDPRRIIHSIKMGVVVTLVSLFYSVRPLYDSFGVAGMWAVLTVVVVFEFTVGGTISKCLNRGFATVSAGALGVGVKYSASCFTDEGEPIVLGILVFILAAASTFTRFMPRIKARYDYGVLIFILTFSLVAISGYRVEEIIVLAEQRIITILIGCTFCMIVSSVICPVWAGQELHSHMSNNVDKLACFLKAFGEAYFNNAIDHGENENPVSRNDNKSLMQSHKSILVSKSTEDSLANLSRWEPYCHGRFIHRHPYKQYLKLGGLVRQCAYQFEYLSACMETNIKVSPEFRRTIHDASLKITIETSHTLSGLASSMISLKSSEVDTHLNNSRAAVEELKHGLRSFTGSNLAQEEILAIIPDATVVSILINIVDLVEKITEALYGLSEVAKFKSQVNPTASPESTKQTTHHQLLYLHRGIVKPIIPDEEGNVGCCGDHVTIDVGNGELPITEQATVIDNRLNNDPKGGVDICCGDHVTINVVSSGRC